MFNWADFWKYYIGEIQKSTPKELWDNFVEISQEAKKSLGKKQEQLTPNDMQAQMIYDVLMNKIHQSLPKLKDQQVGELNFYIRSSVKFPKRIALVYRPEMNTFASWYNAPAKQFEILYPTITIYFKKFIEPLKAGIIHELGHIINGDCLVKKDVKHGQCINIAMDARINMHIDYQMLDYLSRALTFTNEPSFFVKPEDWYPEIGLPVTPGGYSWELAHEQYHFFDSLSPKTPQFPQPKSGQQQLSMEEAEKITGQLNPDQIQEQGEGEDGEEGEEGEGQGKSQAQQKAEQKAAESGAEADSSQEKADDAKKKAKEAAANSEKQAKEKGPNSEEAKQAREDAKKAAEDAKKAQQEAEDAKKKAEKAKADAEKEKAKAETEAEADAKKQGGEKKMDASKNSRMNKGLVKNIDKTLESLSKIKEKYA